MTNYNEDTLNLILKWEKECFFLSKQHSKMASYLKKKYQFFGLLQLLIPIGFTLANQLILDPTVSSTTASVGFSLSGISTVLLNFLNFKAQSVRHELASNSYTIMANDIESILGSHSTIEADVLIARIKNEMKNLQTYSPTIEDCCCYKVT